MDWHLVGVFAEVVSAIAVVTTVLFLAFQIRNNRNATQSASIDALSVGFNLTNYNVIGDGELTRIWRTGFAEPDKLDEDGRVRFSMLMQCYINHYTALRKYHAVGVLPEDEWQAYLAALAGLMNTPGGEWLKGRLTITPALLEEIESFGPTTQEYGWLVNGTNPPRFSTEVQQNAEE